MSIRLLALQLFPSRSGTRTFICHQSGALLALETKANSHRTLNIFIQPIPACQCCNRSQSKHSLGGRCLQISSMSDVNTTASRGPSQSSHHHPLMCSGACHQTKAPPVFIEGITFQRLNTKRLKKHYLRLIPTQCLSVGSCKGPSDHHTLPNVLRSFDSRTLSHADHFQLQATRRAPWALLLGINDRNAGKKGDSHAVPVPTHTGLDGCCFYVGRGRGTPRLADSRTVRPGTVVHESGLIVLEYLRL